MRSDSKAVQQRLARVSSHARLGFRVLDLNSSRVLISSFVNGLHELVQLTELLICQAVSPLMMHADHSLSSPLILSIFARSSFSPLHSLPSIF